MKKCISAKGKEVTIRPVRADDLDQMVEYVNALIQEDTYVQISGKPVTREEEEKFINNQELLLVVEIDGKIAGVAGVTRDKYRKQHVGAPGISLSPQYRDQGIGKIFFETLIEESKKIGLRLLILHCFENNARALKLYESLGFQRIGVIPKAVLYKGEYIGEVDMYLPLVK